MKTCGGAIEALKGMLDKPVKNLVPGAGLEPARGVTPPDFKSGASAFSATPALL